MNSRTSRQPMATVEELLQHSTPNEVEALILSSQKRTPNSLREQARRRTWTHAEKFCADTMVQFAVCIKQNGSLLGPFRCSEQNREMHSCLDQFTSEEGLDKWIEQEMQENLAKVDAYRKLHPPAVPTEQGSDE